MITDRHISKYENESAVDEYNSKVNKIKDGVITKIKSMQDIISEDLPGLQKNMLAEETKKNIDLYHKYNGFLAHEKLKMIEYRSQLNKVEGELTDYYRNHSDISSKLRSEQAIEKYVNAHDCYRSVKELYDTQLVLVQFLENVVGMIRDRAFAIKNLIEVIKIELGMVG